MNVGNSVESVDGLQYKIRRFEVFSNANIQAKFSLVIPNCQCGYFPRCFFVLNAHSINNFPSISFRSQFQTPASLSFSLSLYLLQFFHCSNEFKEISKFSRQHAGIFLQGGGGNLKHNPGKEQVQICSIRTYLHIITWQRSRGKRMFTFSSFPLSLRHFLKNMFFLRYFLNENRKELRE